MKNRFIMRLLLGVFLLLFILISCDENRVFDEYKSISDATWNKEDIVNFDFKLDDTLSRNQVYLKIRNTVDYPFSNIYLFTKVVFPDGKILVDTLEYEMTDEEGMWLGDGVSGIKNNLLYYKKDVVFYEKGEYKLSIQHGMRTENLVGIQDVGLRIERK
jgi:gliding motility-associated lipoprotein GldH